jgi:hypothetical protein
MGCDGCGEEPACATCGTDTQDPAHQRLVWAQTVADAQPGLPLFWRVALAADAYRRPGSDGSRPSPESPISEGVRVTQFLATTAHAEFENALAEAESARASGALAHDAQLASKKATQSVALEPPTTPPDDHAAGTLSFDPTSSILGSPDPSDPWGDQGSPTPPGEFDSCCCVLKSVQFQFFKLPARGDWTEARLEIVVKFKWIPAPKFRGCKLTWVEWANVTYWTPGGTKVEKGTPTDISDEARKAYAGNWDKADPPEGTSAMCPTLTSGFARFRDEPGATAPRTQWIQVSLRSGCRGRSVRNRNFSQQFTQDVTARGQTLHPETGRNNPVGPIWERDSEE